jgi:sugar lactone lactonase YvrE
MATAEHHIQTEPLFPAATVYGASPFWHARSGLWIWLDMEDRRLMAFHPADGARHSWILPSKPGACGPCGSGDILLVLEDGCYTFDLEFGALDPFLSLERYQEIHYFSAGRLDRQGRFWCTAAHQRHRLLPGRLYRLHPDGNVCLEVETLDECRGLDWSPDGRFGYLANVPRRTVDRMEIDRESGAITAITPWVALPKKEGIPAGIQVSADGDVWICHYGGGRISRWSPEGKRKEDWIFPVRGITGCALGGKERRQWLVTSAVWEGETGGHALDGSVWLMDLPGARGVVPGEFVG